MKVLTILACFWDISIKMMLKNESRAKRAKKKLRKFSILGIKNIGPRPLGGGGARRVRPPWIR